jgi:hypothetical protein
MYASTPGFILVYIGVVSVYMQYMVYMVYKCVYYCDTYLVHRRDSQYYVFVVAVLAQAAHEPLVVYFGVLAR